MAFWGPDYGEESMDECKIQQEPEYGLGAPPLAGAIQSLYTNCKLLPEPRVLLQFSHC
jgi:hypothetical protein